ncbi:DUF190 domain-containing protein [Aneurinibacillus sp. Ricciae_BoGa-3]|uniref:DUF190 domain-containing protein n=1 Tax=Aneurinibacillus sp. Ricciae_BoGa-3 TaxID=3022697 RepID=UPI0023413D09|nr:DUF190 domain-containing protein [Aneurinibacillus sp. Ricciae_BoGa-3]WCK54895.1 DUF190 domain-containing protein [Aneurinibacillus sp. Ricciae_BoGa-3]
MQEGLGISPMPSLFWSHKSVINRETVKTLQISTLHEEILQLLRNHKLIWSTVSKGIEGFGKDHVTHKQSIFSFSSHVPIMIESVGKAETIQSIIPEVKEKVQEGLVVAVPVQLVLDR